MWSVLKRDLGEFVTTLKDDAAGTIKAAMTLGEQAESDDGDYEEDRDEVSQRDRRGKDEVVSASLRSLRAEITTYTNDITEAEREGYASFMRVFDLGARTRDIATLLKEDPVVTGMHTDLVPEQVTYDDFWTRYFFRSDRVQRGRTGGITFPHDDDEEDEDFGWDEDDQDDSAGEAVPRTAEHAEDATERGRGRGSSLTQRRSQVSTAGEGLGGEHAAPAAGAEEAAAEISRLKEALKRAEAECQALREAASKTLGGPGGARAGAEGSLDDGQADAAEVIGRLTRERDEAVAEAANLTSKLREVEAEKERALASASPEEAGVATAVEASAGADVGDAAGDEVSRLKAALKEERANFERALAESRRAANEAVEAALSSADAEREEAREKDEDLEALRTQLRESSEASATELAALRERVVGLQGVVGLKEEEAAMAARMTKQLRDEIQGLQAAMEALRPSIAAAGQAASRSGSGRTSQARSDVGGLVEDGDGWGEEDDTLTAASTNSSAVVVEHEQDNRQDGGPAMPVGGSSAAARSAGHRGQPGGVDDEVKQGRGGDALRPQDEHAAGEGHKEGEGDDGWDGWD